MWQSMMIPWMAATNKSMRRKHCGPLLPLCLVFHHETLNHPSLLCLLHPHHHPGRQECADKESQMERAHRERKAVEEELEKARTSRLRLHKRRRVVDSVVDVLFILTWFLFNFQACIYSLSPPRRCTRRAGRSPSSGR